MITISIPFYNLVKETKDVLKQILKSDINFPYQILLVDNGSSEEANFQEFKVQNLKIIKNQINFGVSYAWNQALDFAFKDSNSEILILLNNDIIFPKDSIKNLINFSLKSTKFSLISALAVEKIEDLEKEFPFFSIEDQPNFSFFLIKKGLFKTIGYFDEKNFPIYFNDYDYLYRIKLAGCYGCAFTGSLFYHLESLTLKRTNLIFNYSNSLNDYIKKWGGPPRCETKIKTYEITSLGR